MIEILLAETLTLWGVDATVATAGAEVSILMAGRPVATVSPGDGARWVVRSAHGEHECISVTGALSALRHALGVEGGARLRVTR